MTINRISYCQLHNQNSPDLLKGSCIYIYIYIYIYINDEDKWKSGIHYSSNFYHLFRFTKIYHFSTHTHTHTHTHIYIYIYISSCRTISTDIPDSFYPFFSSVHCFRQVFRATSCIGTELLYVGSSWSSCICSSMWKGPHVTLFKEEEDVSLHPSVYWVLIKYGITVSEQYVVELPGLPYFWGYIIWPTVFEGNPKALFSIAATLRCRKGRYFFP